MDVYQDIFLLKLWKQLDWNTSRVGGPQDTYVG